MNIKKITEKYYWPIRRWITWDLKHIHRDFYKGVKNLLYWFKIIWLDRDWDEASMYKIERHKLKSMLKYFRNTKWIDSESQCRYIQISINLLNIILEQDGRYDDDYVLPYVNVKVIKKFIPHYEALPNKYVKKRLRDIKAIHLYNKIKYMKSYEWWD